MNSESAKRREGTRQSDRQAKALSVDYVSVEERSATQLLNLAAAFAARLNFYNEKDKVEGDWTKMFEAGVETIEEYLNDPESFAVDSYASKENKNVQQKLLNKLSKPHLALFLSFIKLIDYPLSMFQDFTKKHLDFYYKDVLCLENKKGEPDKLHLVFTPADSYDEYVIEEGTMFDAGTDSEGNPLYYKLTDDVTASHIEIGGIKTLRIDSQYLGLNDIRQQYEDGMEVIMKWALGQYFQGDELPSYPDGKYWDETVDMSFLLKKYEDIRLLNITQEDDEYAKIKGYAEDQLCFESFDDFLYCMEIYRRSEDSGELYPSDDEWLYVCEYIEAAYYKRIRRDRINTFIKEREANGLDGLFRMALGSPRSGDALPEMPGAETTFETIYETLLNENYDDEFYLAARYVTDSLGLSTVDFKKIMDVKYKSEDSEATDEDWKEVCTLLQKAETIIRDKDPDKPGRTDIRSIKTDVIASPDEGTEPDIERFSPFYIDESEIIENPDPSIFYGPGLTISSPVLRLSGGQRTITLELACHDTTFNMNDIKRLNDNGELLFDIQFSGEEDWLTLDPEDDAESIDVQVDMIGEELISTYGLSELFIIASIKSESEPRQGEHILFTDGSIWSLEEYRSGNNWNLAYVDRLSGTWDSRLLKSLIPAGDAEEMQNLSITTRGEVIEIGLSTSSGTDVYGSSSAEYFFDYDLGSFVVWTDGAIFQIEEVITATRAKVSYLGTIPDYAENNDTTYPKKYSQISFENSVDVISIEILGVTLNTDNLFVEDDLSRLIVFDNGTTLKIRYLVEDETAEEDEEADEDEVKYFKEALVDVLDSKDPDDLTLESSVSDIEKYSSYPGLRIIVDLDEGQPAITAPGEALALSGLDSTYPVMKVSLANSIVNNDQGYEVVDNPYEFFVDVKLHKATLNVEVTGAQDIRAGIGSSLVDINAPFELFGSSPIAGSAFYFTSPELAEKRLTSLDLSFNWVDLPDDFEEYYSAYYKSGIDNIPKLTNESFKASLSIFNNRSWMQIGEEKELFNLEKSGACKLSYKDGFEKASYKTLSSAQDFTLTNPADFDRYFRLELLDPDFQHDMYSYVLTKLSYSDDETLQEMLVYLPYTPKIKDLKINYSAKAEIKPSYDDEDTVHRMGHANPFGCIDASLTINGQDPSNGVSLFPNFIEDGSLYIGLRNAVPPQVLHILFQTLPGSGEAGKAKPVLRWSYLTQYGWSIFEDKDILEEATDSFINSGIVRLRIPKDASDAGPIMPKGMHWLRISTMSNADVASDIIDIRLHAGLAEFEDQDNADDHLSTPLAAESITGPVEALEGLDSVVQPYSSYGGRMAEQDESFYTRISERLRHKGRALTLWDYERLVLEKFPSLAHTKCICYGEHDDEEETGQVSVVVIPDVSNVSPFLPLEPKVGPAFLENIQDFLETISSPFAQIKAVNPYYQEVLFRVAVRFNTGYGEGFYSKQLSDDITKFLSPWAYSADSEISFGGVVRISSVIYFMENLPYVDYVAMVKLFAETVYNEGTEDEEIKFSMIESGVLTANRLDSILVSAEEHVIDVITTDKFVEDDFIGIGYMIIELDFILKTEVDEGEATENTGITSALDSSKVFSGVGYMIIGLDFVTQ